MSETGPQATVVIVSRNRREDVRRAVRSALEQVPRPPIIVVDDASDDGTDAMVRDEFPEVRLLRSERPSGPTRTRTWAAEEAGTPLVVLIDDDAYFTDPGTVAAAVRDFTDPRVGAVAMPLVDGGVLKQTAPQGGSAGGYATDFFIGAAHALRRDVFLAVGGYRTDLVIYVEEPDLCLRLLAAGYVTKLGTSPPVIHTPHPARNIDQRTARRWRNEFLFKWYHTPLWNLAPAMANQVLMLGRSAVKRRQWKAAAAGLWGGVRGIAGSLGERAPVTADVYTLWRELRVRGAVPIGEIERRLPPIRFTGGAGAIAGVVAGGMGGAGAHSSAASAAAEPA